MNKKRKLKLKRFNIHPIFVFIIMTFILLVLSRVLSLFNVQTTYTIVNTDTLELETKIARINNMLSYDGIKKMISGAITNFISFSKAPELTNSANLVEQLKEYLKLVRTSPLCNLLVALIGLSVAQATGFIEAFTRRVTLNMNKNKLTFLIILFATLSSLINEVGYCILIPLAAFIFSANGRNPILGVVTAFSGVAFGYGTTIFVGSSEVLLNSITENAARIIDPNFHVSLTCNLIIIIITSIVLSIVGTIVVEKLIAPRMLKHKEEEFTKELDLSAINSTEQKKVELEYMEKKGLKKALICGIIFSLLFIYSLIPKLPLSGLLLDTNANTYLDQIFGETSYFQEGFTYMVSLMFCFMGIAYGVAAKTIDNHKDLIKKASEYFQNVGIILILLFFSAQFVVLFNETNIGVFITALLSKMISNASFTGIALILIFILFAAIAGLFVTDIKTKWTIFAPIVIPLMMKSNIAPQFGQFIMRAGDSISKGVTPLLAYFAIYIGYLNIYNKNRRSITMKDGISYLLPYFGIVGATWILIIIGWYLLGAPIGLGVYSTI